MSTCRRCLVSGRVQGVFFRASACQEGERLGLRGRAVNLSDGRVEVVMCGSPAAVEALCAWLHEGPPAARVDSVECGPWEDEGLTGFRPG